MQWTNYTSWRMTTLLVQADHDDSNQSPFGYVEFAKLTWMQVALDLTNSKPAGMNQRGKGEIKYSYLY